MEVMTAAMVAKEDTELQDLLGPMLENSIILYCIKAQSRTAAPSVLDEQEKVEFKIPLVNKSLKKSSNTKDGHLIASLTAKFFQFLTVGSFPS